MSKVQFIDVNKVYDNNVQAVFDFNLEVSDKEFIVLVGPSGCGKSTTLRMLAGLEDISAGQILIDDKVVNDLPPKSRDIAMVFQSYALYPHMSVYDNMAFALKIRGLSKDEIEKRVNYAADILALRPYLDRKPKALSGGQRQRVALGRAIVRTPKVFLMDEPLSNLDAKLRVQMRSEIAKIHQKVGAITIYVTHDQTEAMTMADRIVVMKDGYIQQIGTPKEVYNYPKNMFVGGFVGSPAMNFLNGYCDGKTIKFKNAVNDICIDLPSDKIELLSNYCSTKIKDLEEIIELENKEKIKIENEIALLKPKSKEIASKKQYLEDIKSSISTHEQCLKEFKNNMYPVVLGIRPEDIRVVDKKDSILLLECEISELLGKESIMYTYVAGQRITIVASAEHEIDQGKEFGVKFDFNKLHLFDKETTLRIK